MGGPRVLLSGLADRSRVARERARWGEAASLATLGLAECLSRDDPHELPDFLNLLGSIAFQQGRMEAAETWFHAAHRSAQRLGDPSRRAAALVNMGAVANVRGCFTRALSCYRRGRASYARAGNTLGEARACHNLGLVYADLKRWRRAAACYRAAERLAADGDDPMLAGIVSLNASEVHLGAGDLEAARRACDEAADRLMGLDARHAMVDVDLRYGQIFRRMGRVGLAREHLERAVEGGRDIAAPLSEAEALRALGEIHVETGALEEALECYGRALTLFRSLEAGHELGDAVILEIVETLGRRIEALLPHIEGHSARVARLAAATAARLGLEEARIKEIAVSGYLHHIGVLHLAREVLEIPGPLSPAERVRLQRHAAAGAEHVTRFVLPWDIVPIIRSAHEEFDGTGYPDGLAGEEIPLAARILHAADVYDALVSVRPWRPAWTSDEAMAHLELCAGREFDPRAVEALRETLAAGREEATGGAILAARGLAPLMAAISGNRSEVVPAYAAEGDLR